VSRQERERFKEEGTEGKGGGNGVGMKWKGKKGGRRRGGLRESKGEGLNRTM
jgi:hypothetical protein